MREPLLERRHGHRSQSEQPSIEKRHANLIDIRVPRQVPRKIEAALLRLGELFRREIDVDRDGRRGLFQETLAVQRDHHRQFARVISIALLEQDVRRIGVNREVRFAGGGGRQRHAQPDIGCVERAAAFGGERGLLNVKHAGFGGIAEITFARQQAHAFLRRLHANLVLLAILRGDRGIIRDAIQHIRGAKPSQLAHRFIEFRAELRGRGLIQIAQIRISGRQRVHRIQSVLNHAEKAIELQDIEARLAVSLTPAEGMRNLQRRPRDFARPRGALIRWRERRTSAAKRPRGSGACQPRDAWIEEGRSELWYIPRRRAMMFFLGGALYGLTVTLT